MIWGLTSNKLRPAGWTSADAAGLPIFPGLVKYDEVLAGVINNAIRLTVPQTQDTYVCHGNPLSPARRLRYFDLFGNQSDHLKSLEGVRNGGGCSPPMVNENSGQARHMPSK